MELPRQYHRILPKYFAHPDTKIQIAYTVANIDNTLIGSGNSGSRQDITIAGVKTITMLV